MSTISHYGPSNGNYLNNNSSGNALGTSSFLDPTPQGGVYSLSHPFLQNTSSNTTAFTSSGNPPFNPDGTTSEVRDTTLTSTALTSSGGSSGSGLVSPQDIVNDTHALCRELYQQRAMQQQYEANIGTFICWF